MKDLIKEGDICAALGKKCYTREEASEAEKKENKKSKDKALNIRKYCCEHCHTWHLTHHKRYHTY